MATNGLMLTFDQFELVQRKNNFPPKGFVIYGKSGVGKTTSAAGWPWPMLVQLWDAADKAMPYYDRIKLVGGQVYPPLTEPTMDYDLSAKGDGSLVIPVRYGLNKKGQVALQVEHYEEADPDHPTSYIKWQARMVDFIKESTRWGTMVTDSTTQMSICARNREEALHPTYNDPGLWHAGATNAMEKAWCQRFAAYKCNRVLLMHIKRIVAQTRKDSPPVTSKEDFDGVMIRMLSAPGRLAHADGVPSQYSEVYRMHLGPKDDVDEQGRRRRYFQTQLAGEWNAHSLINAPNECIPEYLALWQNYHP